MKKVYLAAKLGEKDKLKELSLDLSPIGYENVARWLDGAEEGLSREEIAVLDLEDVKRADTIILFTHPRGSLQTGGGRFVEFGYALALKKECIVIGPLENVFMHTPGVKSYETWKEFLDETSRDRAV